MVFLSYKLYNKNYYSIKYIKLYYTFSKKNRYHKIKSTLKQTEKQN